MHSKSDAGAAVTLTLEGSVSLGEVGDVILLIIIMFKSHLTYSPLPSFITTDVQPRTKTASGLVCLPFQDK